MPLPWEQIQANAVTFAKRWKNGWDEKSEAQSFMRDFLRVFGVEDAAAVGRFEDRAVRDAGRGFWDYLWKSKIAIEMKSKGRDLGKAYAQLTEYLSHMPEDEVPELWMVCDFETIVVWRRTSKQRKEFKTKDLKKHIKFFADIAGYETQRVLEDQVEVNVKAAEKMARLHDALIEHGYAGHDLEVYLVRLLFCLFADDTGIFPKDSFANYIEASKADGSDFSMRVTQLFDVLNMPEEVRAKRTALSEELRGFRYINGGLFSSNLSIAEFNAKMRQTLLDCCKFDWNKISPAIFGAMFQGVMDTKQRREMGAHYTSEENILKLINPLFLDELWAEFECTKTDPKQLEAFHQKIARLKFLDPACGCGNFLIITYRELRKLEFEILKMKLSESAYTQLRFGENPLEHEILINVNQFYGIEYEDFPCQIAQVGMWLVDHQMNNLVADHFGIPFVRLPLKASATIVNGNALRIDWESVVPKEELSFILGNPPFVGFTYMNASQKKDMEDIFPKTKNLDYVTSWYMKATEYIQGTKIECAFVSTNSICQGEALPALWKKLLSRGVVINFACTTFVWTNEAKGKAAVHCVIIGFSLFHRRTKQIYDRNGNISVAKHINPYLVDASDIIVESRSKAVCSVPAMVYGNKPADGGNLIIENDEYEDFLAKEPTAKKFVKRMIGATEFINNKRRYCLWLVGAKPSELRSMPLVMERIEKCREMRASSIAAGIRKFAETPTLFAQITQPEGADFIVVPKTSSERRKYIPIGFMTPDVKTNDLVFLIPNATLYHFGIITSNVHMAWVRTVCGRLKSDYRYSRDIGYNTFPWPAPNEKQKAAIEAAAQGVLDARAMFEGSSLADLYDPLTMPPELLKAHKALDKAVWAAYGFTPKTHPSEAAVVAGLMEMWRGRVR